MDEKKFSLTLIEPTKVDDAWKKPGDSVSVTRTVFDELVSAGVVDRDSIDPAELEASEVLTHSDFEAAVNARISEIVAGYQRQVADATDASRMAVQTVDEANSKRHEAEQRAEKAEASLKVAEDRVVDLTIERDDLTEKLAALQGKVDELTAKAAVAPVGETDSKSAAKAKTASK